MHNIRTGGGRGKHNSKRNMLALLWPKILFYKVTTIMFKFMGKGVTFGEKNTNKLVFVKVSLS